MMCGSSTVLLGSSVKDWQAAFLTNIQNGFNTFMGLFPYNAAFATWNPVSVSYYETVGGVKTVRTTPLVDLIIGKTVRERISSQRRRLGRVGG